MATAIHGGCASFRYNRGQCSCGITAPQDQFAALSAESILQRRETVVQPPAAGTADAPVLTELLVENIDRYNRAAASGGLQRRPGS